MVNWDTIKLFTLEPFMFISLFGYAAKLAATTQLIQDKVCMVTYRFGHEVCQNIHEHKDQLNTIMPDTNNYALYLKLILNAPALILLFFVGSWIDKYRGSAKLILLVTTFSNFLESVLLTLNAFYIEWSLTNVLLTGVLPAITGGLRIRMTTAFTQATIETKSELQSIRMALLQFCLVMGASSAGLFVAAIIKTKPFGDWRQLDNCSGIFLATCISELFCFFWILFIFRPKGRPVDQSQEVEMAEVDLNPEAAGNRDSTSNFWTKVVKLWDLRNVTEPVKISLKKRPNYGRLKIWILLFASCVTQTYLLGQIAIIFQFTEVTMGWDNQWFSVVNSVRSFIVQPIGLISMPFFVKVFHLHDTTIGLIGSISAVAECITKGTFLTDAGYYASAAVGVLLGNANIVVRPLLSPLIELHEIGRLFTLVNVAELAIDLASSPLLVWIFNGTLNGMAGFLFQAFAFAMLIPVIVFSFLIVLRYFDEPPMIK